MRSGSQPPELREWAQAVGRGREAEEGPLLRLLARAEREGDEDELYTAQLALFNHYCRYGDRARVLELLSQTQPAKEPEEEACSVATAASQVLHELGDIELAEQLVDHGLGQLSLNHSLGERCAYGARLLSLKLAIQRRKGSAPSEMVHTVSTLVSLLNGPYLLDEELVANLRFLIGVTHVDPHQALALLDLLWANCTREMVLESRACESLLREIEETRSLVLQGARGRPAD